MPYRFQGTKIAISAPCPSSSSPPTLPSRLCLHLPLLSEDIATAVGLSVSLQLPSIFWLGEPLDPATAAQTDTQKLGPGLLVSLAKFGGWRSGGCGDRSCGRDKFLLRDKGTTLDTHVPANTTN